jgi:hypothetical protein
LQPDELALVEERAAHDPGESGHIGSRGGTDRPRTHQLFP